MANIVPVVDRILGKKNYIYEAEMLDVSLVGSDQNYLDVSKMVHGGIHITAVSVGVDAVSIEGSVNGSSYHDIPIVTTGNELSNVFGITSSSLLSTSVRGDGFTNINAAIKLLRLKYSGSSLSDISAKYYGKSW